jgi:hypothetical protein
MSCGISTQPEWSQNLRDNRVSVFLTDDNNNAPIPKAAPLPSDSATSTMCWHSAAHCSNHYNAPTTAGGLRKQPATRRATGHAATRQSVSISKVGDARVSVAMRGQFKGPQACDKGLTLMERASALMGRPSSMQLLNSGEEEEDLKATDKPIEGVVCGFRDVAGAASTHLVRMEAGSEAAVSPVCVGVFLRQSRAAAGAHRL